MKVRNRAIGSVCELVAHGAGKYITEFAVESEDGSEIATYSTIEELLEYWETYKPTEPLIKDEKIRKALRVWADENRIEKVGFKLDKGRSSCACYFYDESCDICEFGLKFYIDIEHDRIYTIVELCGEEGE